MVRTANAYKQAGWPEQNLYIYLVDEASATPEQLDMWKNTSQ